MRAVCAAGDGGARAKGAHSWPAHSRLGLVARPARWRKTQLVGLSVPEPPSRRGSAGAGRAERRSWVGPGRGALRSAARRARPAGVPRAAAHGRSAPAVLRSLSQAGRLARQRCSAASQTTRTRRPPTPREGSGPPRTQRGVKSAVNRGSRARRWRRSSRHRQRGKRPPSRRAADGPVPSVQGAPARTHGISTGAVAVFRAFQRAQPGVDRSRRPRPQRSQINVCPLSHCLCIYTITSARRGR